jgi:uncharacterized OB-fold protein
MNAYNKPLPVEDADSSHFWAGCRNQKLLLQHCQGCNKARYPASAFCPHCTGRSFEWRESAGRGEIYSWVVVRHPVPKEVYGQEVPYVIALIDLQEGVRMASNVVGCDPDAVHAAMQLQVVFKSVTPEVTLPLFSPWVASAA